MVSRRARVCIVGPLVGRNPGYVTTQGEKLADLLTAASYSVIEVSSSTNRYVRLADIVGTIVRHRNDIDVMVIFTYGLASFVVEDVASQLASRFHIPIVLSLCGGAFPSFVKRFPRWTRRVLDRATMIVCQSEYLARVMRELGRHPTVVKNIVDVTGYPHRVRETVRPRLFWMRAFDDLYNPEMAIRSLEHVHRTYPEAMLVMAGRDFGIQRKVEQAARTRGLEANVRFPGFLDLAGKIREAETTDIFINTPRIDNRPICVVEAAALGMPIVSTNVGGIPDLIEDEVSALLVADNDAEGMALAIHRLVEDPVLARRLSIQGRDLAEMSSIANVRPVWENILAEVVRPVT